ncbi:OLC1v1007840C1 [Oldenlandia corymbosa var. corymbosa]|uniref:OLC1v1007840C1 n=1 Tax=Oldenlandia corymbosa var. corymbosa TaxID=529605 RepID=A0AAV1DLN1_OLDCO|nr:OLC1v1007840C1 [Oldenlandia corymbosa var. corymbosa]
MGEGGKKVIDITQKSSPQRKRKAEVLSEDSKVCLKLIIDSENNKVLFAEADKRAVDFLVHILTLPLGVIMSLTNEPMRKLGSLGNLYDSVENLSESYIQPNQTKDRILKLNPQTTLDEPFKSSPFFVAQTLADQTLTEKVAYLCSGSCSSIECFSDQLGAQCFQCNGDIDYEIKYIKPPPQDIAPRLENQSGPVAYVCDGGCDVKCFSDKLGAKCCECNEAMDYQLKYIVPPKEKKSKDEEEGGFVSGAVKYMVMDDLTMNPMSALAVLKAGMNAGNPEEKVVDIGTDEEGFVKGAVTYMVMDDLTVKPVSTVDLLKGLDGRDAETLEEKVVDIGQEEAMKLLSTILVSKTVLTDVFLSNIGSKPEVKTETEISVKKIPMKRVAKDLKRPKRPASAFFVFMDEFRKIYKENNPNNASANATGRAGGYKWKSMSDEEKAPYQAISDQMKVDYQNELAAYNKWLAEGLSPKNEELDNSWTEVNVREIQ